MIGSLHEKKGIELALVLVFKCTYHCSYCCHPHCNHSDKNNDMSHRCYDNLRADDSCGMLYRNTHLYLCANKYVDCHLFYNQCLLHLDLHVHVQNYAVSSLGEFFFRIKQCWASSLQMKAVQVDMSTSHANFTPCY